MHHISAKKSPPSGRPQVVVASVRWCCCWPLLGGVPSPHWGGHRRMLPSEESPHSVKEVMAIARSEMKGLAMMQYNLHDVLSIFLVCELSDVASVIYQIHAHTILLLVF